MSNHPHSDRMAKIRSALAALEPDLIELIDESHLHAGHAGAQTGRGHYRLSIRSARFHGLNAVARHRLVYGALGPLMQSDIHALSIDARSLEDD
ncbi:MAG TPA: BolA family transcriptional regulator [Gammaproteobacteria bacterium]|nr:BolA family transcriptional regulator [Gammaproteobacteria bacterium]